MSEKGIEKENKPTFAHCVCNKAIDYYKVVGVVGVVVALLIAAVFAGVKVLEYVLPALINFAIYTPIWITVPALVLVAPLVTALIVCWKNRNEREIKKVDEDYTCQE